MMNDERGTANGKTFFVRGQLSVVRGQLSVVRGQLFKTIHNNSRGRHGQLTTDN